MPTPSMVENSAGMPSAAGFSGPNPDGEASPASAPSLRASSDAAGLTPAEFAVHFRESFRTLWLIAMGVTRDAGLAEDVVQEAAVIALGKLNQFERGSNFAAWMGQTVRFVAYNAGRKEQRRRPAATDPSQIDRRAAGADAASDDLRLGKRGEYEADHLNLDDRMVAALNKLAETARACLLLRTVGGLEYSEIAKLLEIPEGTAMSHVHRTRMLLRRQIGTRDGRLGSA
jgi:RNA polymerase sigma-70 factor, ECF subfamily